METKPKRVRTPKPAGNSQLSVTRENKKIKFSFFKTSKRSAFAALGEEKEGQAFSKVLTVLERSGQSIVDSFIRRLARNNKRAEDQQAQLLLDQRAAERVPDLVELQALAASVPLPTEEDVVFRQSPEASAPSGRFSTYNPRTVPLNTVPLQASRMDPASMLQKLASGTRLDPDDYKRARSIYGAGIVRAAAVSGGLKKTPKKKYKKKYTRKGYTKRSYPGKGGRGPTNIIQGLGAYTAPRSAGVGEAFGAGIGGLLPLPGPLGAAARWGLGRLGGWAGNKLGTIFGLGQYDVNQNSIIHEGQSPAMMHSTDDTIVVRHREYIGDVFSADVPGQFTVQHFQIQPGLAATFEWLHPIANQYQEWIPHGIVMEFKSNAGEVVTGANAALGQVIMATDYNAHGPNPFDSKNVMLNTMYSTNTKITESMMHPVECAPHRNVFQRLYIRQGAIPAGQPAQLYDLATFAIASVGVAGANVNLGELWMTYEIGLSKSSMITTHTSGVPTDRFQLSAPFPGQWNYNTHFPLLLPHPDNSLGTRLAASGVSNQGLIIFPENLDHGFYEVTVHIQGTLPGNCNLITSNLSVIRGRVYRFPSGAFTQQAPLQTVGFGVNQLISTVNFIVKIEPLSNNVVVAGVLPTQSAVRLTSSTGPQSSPEGQWYVETTVTQVNGDVYDNPEQFFIQA